MPMYVVEPSTMTNIADAIREKTGVANLIFPENMPAHIRSIQSAASDTSGIPEDIVAEAKRVASGMISKMGVNALTFVAVSDMHEMGDSDSTYDYIIERYRRANLNAGQAAKLIADKVPLDFFTNLGDFAWGSDSTTIRDGVQSIRQGREYIEDVVRDNISFVIPGNHDPLTYSYSANGTYLSREVIEGLLGTYCYRDFEAKKIRVICLNTADVEGMTVTSSTGVERMTGAQLQWFAESLDLSAKSDASEWGIVILSHHPLDWGNIKVAANCLAAYLDGSSYSVTHNGVAVFYDFAGKNKAAVIAQFHGHVHGFKVDYIQDLRTGSPVPTTVKRIAIPNACFGRNNEYGENGKTESNGIEFGEETSYEKTDDSTGKNTAFCLVSIDLDEKVIYADCFGAGYDRIVGYGEVVIETYSVTNNLNNAESSNGSTTVEAGASYTATITAKDGYELESITVTMGGADITTTAVSGSGIVIASVTGDIVITAKAKATASYDVTNQVPLSLAYESDAVYNNGLGYKDGYRISTSASNYEGTGAGFTLTGYIPYSVPATGLPKPIYVRGLNWTADTNCRLYFFGSDKKHIQAPQITGSGTGANALSTYYTLENLGDAYWKLTPVASGSTSAIVDTSAMATDTVYIRFSLKGSGAGLIITIDEPIE